MPVTFLENLLSGQPALPAGPRAWLGELRGAALDRAHRLSAPTTRDEDWRFTDLSPLYALAFASARAGAVPALAAIEPYVAPESCCRIVFVDGRHVPALSAMAAPGDPVAVQTLAAAIAARGDLVRRELAQIAAFDADAFNAVNTAYLHDGVFIHAPRDVIERRPLQLLFVSTQTEVATHPRVLVIADSGADILLLEDHVALTDDGAEGAYCVNAVTEVAVGENARVRHVKVQREGASAFHIATTAARVERSGAYESTAVAAGARISRHALNVRQNGEGARIRLEGLALVGDRQLADTHSFIDHAVAHGESRQMHKCVVSGRGHAVFNGRILVRPGAQRTDSAQQSRNLLLSPDAFVDTKPQLEIFADDVKCAHGATVGQLESEELFYLRSRGLAEIAARNLLTYGFAAEVIDRIPVASVAQHLRARVLAQTRVAE